jgi:hypothetical protein
VAVPMTVWPRLQARWTSQLWLWSRSKAGSTTGYPRSRRTPPALMTRGT